MSNIEPYPYTYPFKSVVVYYFIVVNVLTVRASVVHAKTDSVVHARNQLSCARGCWCPFDGDDGDDDDDDDDDDKVAVPVCAQEHERYYPAPPHPTPPVTDHEQCLCVHRNMNIITSPHPTPPHR